MYLNKYLKYDLQDIYNEGLIYFSCDEKCINKLECKKSIQKGGYYNKLQKYQLKLLEKIKIKYF